MYICIVHATLHAMLQPRRVTCIALGVTPLRMEYPTIGSDQLHVFVANH